MSGSKNTCLQESDWPMTGKYIDLKLQLLLKIEISIDGFFYCDQLPCDVSLASCSVLYPHIFLWSPTVCQLAI